jgi:antitoxin component of MazEF toxin-antitoxin module
MPITRSIHNLGNSKAVTIPKSWLTNAEDQTGRKVIAIAMEVSDKITLQPIFEKEIKQEPTEEPKQRLSNKH